MGLTIAIVVAILGLASPVWAQSLLVSTSPTRSNPVALDGTTQQSLIYVFVPSSGVTRVQFWLDNPTMSGTPRQIEGLAPFDFAGTAPDRSALPFATTTVADGQHTISAIVDRSTGGPVTLRATFTVANVAPPPPPPPSTCEGDLTNCQADLSTTTAALAATTADLAAAEAALQASQAQVAAVQSIVCSTCSGSLAACQTTLSTTQVELQAAKGDKAACQSQLNACQQSLSTCQSNQPLPVVVAPELRATTTLGTPVSPVRVTATVTGVSEYVMHDPGAGQWDWHVRRISPGVWDVSFTPITVGTFRLTIRVKTATQIYEQPFVVEVR